MAFDQSEKFDGRKTEVRQMIRKFQAGDLEAIMSIWLSANLEAHSFIDPDYWRGNYDTVKTMIPQAEVHVSEDENRINGFVGLMDNYIAGIFVDGSVRFTGIGSQLLDRAKQNRNNLCLSVYKKNTAAAAFYRRRGFQIDTEAVDPETGEAEYTMTWHK